MQGQKPRVEAEGYCTNRGDVACFHHGETAAASSMRELFRESREEGQAPIDSLQDLFFSQDFEQVIEAWTCVAAGHSETCGMNKSAYFNT